MLIRRALLTLLLLSPAPALATTICLDPGHGGSDPGAVGCGLREASINLDTQLRLRSLLQGAGLNVIMTRETDVAVGLSARAEYANARGASRFVSIHSNSASSASATGIETFCAVSSSSNSVDLRNKIQAEMVATWPLPNRGGKTANFTVLTATSMPATLSELGFIVNCAADATYLGSPAHRQEAAEAHLRALQRHLGMPVGTPSTPPPPTAPPTGELKGVVFVDHGSGTDDMSERLPGAALTVVESGAQATASDGDAAWSFALAPATYHLRASRSGYQTAERSCAVTAGATTWCSIGLQPETVVPPQPPTAPPPPAVDAGSGASVDASAPATPPPAAVDAGAAPDAEGADADEPGWPDPSMVPFAGRQQEDSVQAPEAIALGQGMGCSGLPAQGGPGWLALAGLALWGLRRRSRRRVHGALIAGLALLGGAASAQTVEEAATGLPRARLVRPQLVLDGEVSAPVLSPDGRQLAFSSRQLQGLYVVDVAEGGVRTVSERPHAGYRPEWSVDGQGLALRLPDRPHAAEPLELYGLRGEFRGPLAGARTRAVEAREDSVWVLDGGRALRVTGDDDKYFAPVLSPDGLHLVYSGIASGLYLLRIDDGRRVHLGQGSHARFSPDGRWLVFDRSQDDGQQLTGSDLFRTDLRHPRYRTENLTRTPDLIEQFPSLSADGRRIAFAVEGQLWVAEIREAR